MPCGVTMRPLPKFASTSPVLRSNLKIGSTGLVSQLTRSSASAPAPQRSYAQMLPSIGSISIPAEEPHIRPSGSLPQFAVIIGAGLGRPSPVIGLPTAMVLAAPESGEHPLTRTKIEAHSTDISTGRKDINEDMAVSLSRSRVAPKYPPGVRISLGQG